MHRFPFPLYHGTSSIFIPSIIDLGLGGHDPVAASGGVECLKRLLLLADRHLSSNDSWQIERPTLEAMCQQRVTNGNMNFRHGTIYVSPARDTAVQYALTNSHGSELLSSCINVYKQLKKTNESLVAFVEIDFPEIASLALSMSVPILIRIDGQSIASLRTEQGSDPTEQIEMMLGVGESHREDLSLFNFELIETVPNKRLNLSRIVNWSIDDYVPKYSLEPILLR